MNRQNQESQDDSQDIPFPHSEDIESNPATASVPDSTIPPEVAGVEEYIPLPADTSPIVWEEYRWYMEYAVLLLSTVKWAVLGAIAGACVGIATRVFLLVLSWANSSSNLLNIGWFHHYDLLVLALPWCVWLVRTFAPTARGHGTEAVIAAVHTCGGKINLVVAPIKLLATVLTIAFGGSVGKEGPAAQIGAAITSGFADLLRFSDEDRRRLVICGIGAGFAAVFGTPISGALFGVEVLYLGRIEYPVLFPCLVAGIIAHLVCGVKAPVPALQSSFGRLNATELVLLSLVFGAIFGLIALALIETMRGLERGLRRFMRHPYLVAAAGGIFLDGLYRVFGNSYAGLGTATIESALRGSFHLLFVAFAIKILATAVSLEAGGSGGIVTPLFFIGATAGAGLATLFGLPAGAFAAFGFVAVVAAAANTPIAASVMGIELLPGPVGVYAALCACTAYLTVGHRSVYSSQKLSFSKAASLEVPLGITIGEISPHHVQVRRGLFTGRLLHRIVRLRRRSSPPR